LILNRLTGNIPNSRIEEFVERIHQMLDDFMTADTGAGTPDTKLYAITVAFYPSFYFSEGNAAEESNLDE
jgi:hypothetical protein